MYFKAYFIEILLVYVCCYLLALAQQCLHMMDTQFIKDSMAVPHFVVAHPLQGLIKVRPPPLAWFSMTLAGGQGCPIWGWKSKLGYSVCSRSNTTVSVCVCVRFISVRRTGNLRFQPSCVVGKHSSPSCLWDVCVRGVPEVWLHNVDWSVKLKGVTVRPSCVLGYMSV